MPAPSAQDRFMIDDLFIRYTCALDAGDIETLVACFAEDGSLVSPAVGEHKGRPAIREFARRFARFRERGSQLRHVISNLRIEVHGDCGASNYKRTNEEGTVSPIDPGRRNTKRHRLPITVS